MEANRRDFLKIAGLAALGFVVTKPALDIVSNLNQAQASLNGETHANIHYAMTIDINKCAALDGCTACMDRCHYVHNVPGWGVNITEEEALKWIWKGEYEAVFPEHEHLFLEGDTKHIPVVVMCNHCEEPPCVKVCPTQATWKREMDGIVMVDYHRCIGCRYCMGGCPYGARSFNWRNPREDIKELYPDYPTRTRGVVEKCNFCAERLVDGLPPACVEVCPNHALTFGDLNDPDSEIREHLRTEHIVQRFPELGTKPSTYYIA